MTYSPPDNEKIQTLFSQIAHRYDWVNAILSWGMHILWKKKLVSHSPLPRSAQILDVATGTGDLAFFYEKELERQKLKGNITGIDFCDAMLIQAWQKAKQRRSQVCFQKMDVHQLTFPADSFDCISLAFGIRNFSSPQQALQELYRVLKPQGSLLILEFGQPSAALFRKLFQLYSQLMIVGLGGILSGQKKAYQYLHTSSASFPSGHRFAQLLPPSSYEWVLVQPLAQGIAYLYHLKKP